MAYPNRLEIMKAIAAGGGPNLRVYQRCTRHQAHGQMLEALKAGRLPKGGVGEPLKARRAKAEHRGHGKLPKDHNYFKHHGKEH